MLANLLLALAAGVPVLATGVAITTVAGGGAGDGGPAVDASFGRLGEIHRDAAGNLFVADVSQGRIRRVDRLTGKIETVVQTDPKDGPRCFVLDDHGHLIWASRNTVVEIDLASGDRRRIAGTGKSRGHGRPLPPGVSALDADLQLPASIAAFGRRTVFAELWENDIVTIGPGLDTFSHLTSHEAAPGETRDVGLPQIQNLAFDPSGQLYLSNPVSNRIFRWNGESKVAVAGNGSFRNRYPARVEHSAPQEGDGGAATAAPLDHPGAIAFDQHGTFYFGEGHASLRRVDAHGTITTISGPDVSKSEVSGVAITSSGEIDFALNSIGEIGRVFRWEPDRDVPIAGSGVPHCCGDGGPARSAPLARPWGVAVAPDHALIIADRSNGRIRRIDPAAGVISTIAGGGNFALPGAQRFPGRRNGEPPPPGRVEATKFKLIEPQFVAVDADGVVYFASDSGPVYRIDAGGNSLSALGMGRTVLGERKPRDGFLQIGGIVADPRRGLVVAAENRIWSLSVNGAVGLVAGTGRDGFTGDGGFGVLAELAGPAWPVVDRKGEIEFVDTGNFRIRRVDRSGTITTVAGNGQSFSSGEGTADREAIGPASGLAIDARGDLVFATGNLVERLSLANRRLTRVAGGSDSPGIPSLDEMRGALRSPGRPLAIAVDRAAGIYFSEPDDDRVRLMGRLP